MPFTYTEKTLKHEGYRFPTRLVHGADPSLVPALVLGGAYQSMDSLRKLVEGFLPERTVLMADLPGSGEADYLPVEFGADFYGGAIATMIERLGVPRVAIVAASYGALTAYRFAQLYPESVTRMALIGFVTELTPEQHASAENHLRNLDALGPDEVATFIIDHLLTTEHRHLVNRAPGVLRLLGRELRQLGEENLCKHRANIARLYRERRLDTENPPGTPMLLFTGEYDHFTRPEHMRRLAAGFDNAIFTTIDRADHLCHLEQPAAVSALVKRFFDGATLDGVVGCGPIERFDGGP